MAPKKRKSTGKSAAKDEDAVVEIADAEAPVKKATPKAKAASKRKSKGEAEVKAEEEVVDAPKESPVKEAAVKKTPRGRKSADSSAAATDSPQETPAKKGKGSAKKKGGKAAAAELEPESEPQQAVNDAMDVTDSASTTAIAAEDDKSEVKIETVEDVTMTEKVVETTEAAPAAPADDSLSGAKRKQPQENTASILGDSPNVAAARAPKSARKEKPAPEEASEPPSSGHKSRRKMPTKEEVESDRLTILSREKWARDAEISFEPQIVEDVYSKELSPDFPLNRIVLLDFSSYLERYLWPSFDAEKSTRNHVLSIVVMVNEKFRDNVPAWDCFETRKDVFPAFFSRVLSLRADTSLSMKEKCNLVAFYINSFQSLENEMVRAQCLRLVSLPLWTRLNPGRLQLELKLAPQLDKHWKSLMKKQRIAEKKGESLKTTERTFLFGILDDFRTILSGITAEPVDGDSLRFCERTLVFVIDLLAQLPTRRFFLAPLMDSHFLNICLMSNLAKLPSGRLFTQLLDMLTFYLGFEINEHTGLALTADDMTARHYARMNLLQRLSFKYFPDQLKPLALSNVAAIENRVPLSHFLSPLSDGDLYKLASHLRLFPKDSPSPPRAFVLEVILSYHEKRVSQLDAINGLPLYPNENILWDENVVPTNSFNGEQALALPKLNLQFLTFHDYLLRNFNLFRLESTYEIREDIDDQIRRVGPRLEGKSTVFTGWARMVLPIKEFRVSEVSKPLLGEHRPAKVLAEVSYDVNYIRDPSLKRDWETFREHDVVFLVTVEAHVKRGDALPPMNTMHPKDWLGVKYIRGAEVVGMIDEHGRVIHNEGDAAAQAAKDRAEGKEPPRSSGPRTTKKLQLKLDTCQYQIDMEQMHSGENKGEDVYTTFNLILRRKAQENNFKPILDCIRDIINTPTVNVPTWLHDIMLGYGDPTSANYKSLVGQQIREIDFVDTLLDKQHCIEAFGSDVIFEGPAESHVPPFKVLFPSTSQTDGQIVVRPYRPADPGPYPEDQPKQNIVRFTPVQIEAIRSGINPGMTLIVGPPGTGKTDVAVQILNNLYHTFPTQRVLLVTHSNHALNDIFEKTMVLDIHERHMLRLGRGEEDLMTERDYSKYGRVQFMLAKRIELLAEVSRLALSIGVVDTPDYTCETAAHFYLFQVYSRWEEFVERCKQRQTAECVAQFFPFNTFFSTSPKKLFNGVSYEEDMRSAEGCFTHIKNMFDFVRECRAFEILRSYNERANYLVTTQAKIIAMTCTHAAMKRHEFIDLGFEYDTLIMEEAAQVLEIETFIPMVLQRQRPGQAVRLQRIILIGDHNQLPPVIKNQAFQKYSHMDVSLFTRFIRLGVPAITLDMQGRARAGIADLYNWRYSALQNMPHVVESTPFQAANTGFSFDYQFVDVSDGEESEPTAYFYQNVAEAEFSVATYMYMRMLGYPASSISILSTYNGQAELIKDICVHKCGIFGPPANIATVDKFQGQQSDYVILSLVRSKAVGHIRDIRRLVVAMSRARLGLYVFGQKSLFGNCYELTRTFSRLLARPTTLSLVQDETFPTNRKINDAIESFEVAGVQHMWSICDALYAQYATQIQQRQQRHLLPTPGAAQPAVTSDPMVE